MKKILPIYSHNFWGDPAVAYLVLILGNHPDFSKWVINNLTNIYMHEDSSARDGGFVKVDNLLSNPLLRTYSLPYEIFEHTSLPKSLFKKLLKEDFYIYGTFNRKMLNFRKEESFAHIMLIYGFEKSFSYYVDFMPHKNGRASILKSNQTSLSSWNKAIYGFENDNLAVYLIKLNYNQSLDFDIPSLTSEIKKILSGTNFFQEDNEIYKKTEPNYIFTPNNCYTFGKNAFITVSNFLLQTDYYKPRHLIIIRDFLTIWKIRISYLIEYKFIITNSENILELIDTSISQINNIFLRFLKLRYATDNNQIARDKLSKDILRLWEQTEIFLLKTLENLGNL
ncbi:hypothetical protein [Streptococcus oralis]|uniref:hypothetical protein n=1 Tax=Streptococcus oralis TaxID=1303 RepID=UPI002284F91D|nr:hypothetical protein [Streptococcus oralis]MCY7079201.1 hypothetical protein [Streptococcus oralis]